MSDENIQNNEQKEFVEPVAQISATIGWFMLQSMVQAVVGWIGVQIFRRMCIWIKKLFKRGEYEGEGASEEIPGKE